MNAMDIELEIMKELGKLQNDTPSLFTEQQLLENFELALFNYTSRKIRAAGISDTLVYDLRMLFDVIDTRFNTKEEMDDFYQNYVFCLINHCNMLDKEKLMLWEEVSEDNAENTYPSIEEKDYIRFFQTGPKTSKKEAALWLFSYMDNNYKAKKEYSKKREFITCKE